MNSTLKTALTVAVVWVVLSIVKQFADRGMIPGLEANMYADQVWPLALALFVLFA